MSVKERLIEYLKHERLSARSFSISIGMSPTYVSSMRKSIQPEVLSKIAVQYPELNTGWLLTGEGEMIKGHKPKFDEVTPVDNDEYMMVEYVDLRASAGKLGEIDLQQLPETHKRLVPKEYAKGSFLVVRVDGDSMYDGSSRSLSDGDEVLIYEHKDNNLENLPIKKTLFVITTREGNVLKQITEINRKEGYMICHSFNPKYEDFRIELQEVCQIFIVCKIVQKQISLN